ncbi:hypothetical protein J0910_22795 [Nocardiopsis sp. CNT-189]|uniref:DUF6461 domain-containing protein n=1 Tax=Nocardiopsis oceanisediminis TaxID=2816862 RepID=UPI003B372242
MAAALAADYAWFEESQPDLAEAFCLTYVRGLGKTECLERLGAAPKRLRMLPIADALEAGLCSESRPPQTAHALCVNGWTVIVEPTGCRAVRPDCYRSLSAETELVSVRVRMDARYEFRWVAGGVLRTFFDARTPTRRRGTRPDALTAEMASVGLLDEAGEGPDDPAAAVLALAERVTGVRIRPSHLSGPLLGAELETELPAPAASAR